MASIRQRSGKWQARVIRVGYPAEVKSFGLRIEAQMWAREIEAAMDRGTHLASAAANELLLRELLARYRDEVTPSKRGHLDEVIRIGALQRTRMASYSIGKLSPAVVAEFRDSRLQKVKAGAVIRDLSLLSSVINHARREWGVSVANPCALVKKPASPAGRSRVLSPAEEQRLLDALLPKGRLNRLMHPLVRLAILTAMRRGELLGLEWQHIAFDRQTAYLPMTKSGMSRTVPLSSDAVALLTSLPRSGPKVFPVEAQTVAAAFMRARNRAGLPDFRFHDLRHTATSRLAVNLPNVIELASVTGHRTIQMLKRYYHPCPEALAKKLG